MKLNLRQRVALWSAGLVVATGVAAVLVVVVLSGRLLDQRAQEAARRLGPASGSAAAAGTGAGASSPAPLSVDGTAGPGTGAGTASPSSSGQLPGAPPAGQLPAGQVPTGQIPTGQLPAGQGAGTRPAGPTALDLAQRDAAHSVFEDVRNIGIATVVVMTVLALGASWVAAGRVVQPLHAVTATARSITRDSRLDRRIAHQGPDDDVHELAESFDGMLDRLEAVFDAQKAFVSNTSHELRTPLAVMRAEVDVALDDPNADEASLRAALKAVGEEVRSTTGLVSAMLDLARAEAVTNPVDVDLAASAARALEGLAPAFRAAHPVVVDLEEAPVVGDPVLLGQLVANLVRNAEKYNRDGGMLAVATGTSGADATVVVENDGPVVEPEVAAKLFGRFVRRSEAGEGYGLGLAIVHAIAATHGGTVTATSRPEGGLRVEVRLPAGRRGRPATTLSAPRG
ncbi:MAG: HAMP domain-containing sensor histidine kinase [Acidimicrobiales bacterium]